MNDTIQFGLIADFDAQKPSHIATLDGLKHTAAILSLEIEVQWLPTEPFEKPDSLNILKDFDGIWGAPGVPESSLGYVNAIQYAREKRIPYLGT